MSDYHDHIDARCRASMDRAQRERDLQQPPDYYDEAFICPECCEQIAANGRCLGCGEFYEPEWTDEDYRADAADRWHDEGERR